MQRPPNRPVEYEAPRDLAEAQARQRELVEEISTIAAQLADPDRRQACSYCKLTRNPDCRNCRGEGSVRYDTEGYQFWRRGAMTAMKAKEATLRRLTQWVDAFRVEQQQQPQPQSASSPDASRLVGAAYLLLKNLVDDDVDFEPAELAIINSLKEYLEAQCPPKQRFPARSAGALPSGHRDSTTTVALRTATSTQKP